MREQRQNRLKRQLTAALFAALLAVLSPLSVPFWGGVSLTMQTFLVALGGYLLGPLWGAVGVGLYLLLGAVGLPVFAGWQSGPVALFGPTGGFLAGFFPLVCLCGRATKARWPLLWGLTGLALCHVCGVLWAAALQIAPLSRAVWVLSAPYWLKDGLSVAAARWLAPRFHRVLPKSI